MFSQNKEALHTTKGNLVTADIWLRDWVETWHLMETINKGLKLSKTEVVKIVHHAFKPQGDTVVWILSESHCALHTYPEQVYFSIDVYTCGFTAEPDNLINHVIETYPTKKVHTHKLERGYY